MKIPVKVACIGGGFWGKNLIRTFNDLESLRRICEPDPERRAELSRAYPSIRVGDSVDHVLADSEIGAVAIASPAATHGKLVRQALVAGKDVFVEKPLCLSIEEGRSLVKMAAERGRILMVGHLLWYHPAVLRLKELVADGELGRIRYIYSNRLNLGRIRREENILWSFAPHDVSVILGLVGEMPDRIDAQGGNYLHERIADVTVSMLAFPSGVRAHIFVSWLHPYKEQKLVVVGDRRMAVFDDVEKVEKLRLYPHSVDWKNQLPVVHRAEAQAVDFDTAEPLRRECEHFLECVQVRRTPRTDGEEGLRVLTVLDGCQQALSRGTADSRPTMTTTEPPGSAQVHSSSVIDENVEIGSGTSIWHFSHVLSGSRIGRDCRIGQNVVIGPDASVGDGVKIQNNVSVYKGVTLEDHVFCGPSMVFTNVVNPRSEIRRMDELRRTLVRRGASLGANCTVVCGVTIGTYAFVGAGAVVVKDVPDFALVVGNPGRIIGWMCMCGERIRFADEDGQGGCAACGREYRKDESRVTTVEAATASGRPNVRASEPRAVRIAAGSERAV